MARPSNQIPDPSASAARQMPTLGLADVSTSTTQESLDLSQLAGRYVEIFVDVDTYVAGDTDGTGSITLLAATTPTNLVPAIAYAGVPNAYVVPEDKPFLLYQTLAGSGFIRVVAA